MMSRAFFDQGDEKKGLKIYLGTKCRNCFGKCDMYSHTLIQYNYI